MRRKEKMAADLQREEDEGRGKKAGIERALRVLQG